MKFISLFSGIGGFDLALERLGHTCVYANDIDKYCKIIYDKHFETKQTTQDIRTVKSEDLPDFDLLCGGFPCQSFSIAGKRGGFDDTRGTLFFEIARILRDKQPRLLILENVKGLLSHDNGRTFKTIIATLAELGYDVEWQVLNSKNFGVPQNRERVFIIGHLRGEPRPEVFPFGESNGGNIKSGDYDNSKIARTVSSRFAKGVGNTESRIIDVLIKPDSGQRFKSIEDVGDSIRQLNNPVHSNNRVYGAEGISPTLNTMQGGNRQPKIVQRQPLKFLKRNQRNIEGDYAFTVDAFSTSGVRIDSAIRRLTPLECERLQGFPDGWTDGVSDTQRYKMCGNAVTVNVVYEIARRLV